MKTKLVYVLTSTPADIYLEMAYLSVYSARHYNPNAHIVLVADKSTVDTCGEGLRKDFIGLFDEVHAVDCSQYESNIAKSRYLKTNLRTIVRGDYLYIDGDTIISGDLSGIDDTPTPMAAVQDIHLDKEKRTAYWEKYEIEYLIGDSSHEYLFNGGVLYVKDVPENYKFYERWYEHLKEGFAKGKYLDQPPFHQACKDLKPTIGELDGTWNCQIAANYLTFFNDAKIIHFFTGGPISNPYLLKNKEYYKKIKETGGITPELEEIVLNPQKAFEPISLVIGLKDIKIVHTKVYLRTRLLYYEHPFLYKLLCGFSTILISRVIAGDYLNIILKKLHLKK